MLLQELADNFKHYEQVHSVRCAGIMPSPHGQTRPGRMSPARSVSR